MARKIGVKRVLEALEKVVDEAPRGPDTVYHGDIAPDTSTFCEYAIGGTPACIVGRVVMAEFGLPEPLSGTWTERGQVYAVETKDLPGSLETYQAFTPKANQVLRAAQEVQDRDRPWGEALDAAKERARS